MIIQSFPLSDWRIPPSTFKLPLPTSQTKQKRFTRLICGSEAPSMRPSVKCQSPQPLVETRQRPEAEEAAGRPHAPPGSARQ